KIFTVPGPGGVLDCLYISCRGDIKTHKHHKPTHTDTKLVLFCPPNAGFYEVLSQCDFESSWVGYYLNRGYDVFTFNYRGYGRSQGVPSSQALKQDGLVVFQYVLQHYPAKLYVLHGESIGGMVACHIAAHNTHTYTHTPSSSSSSSPSISLICDRTFGSLDAAAARIMAQWAGQAMRHLALWKTDVVSDYLAATCDKLVLQVMGSCGVVLCVYVYVRVLLWVLYWF
ncbi:alpha/beta fold hydrolase, partial [archaeon]